jgi:UDP-N-acetylmuramyl pentapeptide synthase
MFSKFKKLILFYFKISCKLILKTKKPFIIGITGSAGKTTTKEMIFYVLEKYKEKFPEEFKENLKKLKINFKDLHKNFIFKNYESLNNEFGIPITIFLCNLRPGRNILNWLKIFLMSFLVFF